MNDGVIHTIIRFIGITVRGNHIMITPDN